MHRLQYDNSYPAAVLSLPTWPDLQSKRPGGANFVRVLANAFRASGLGESETLASGCRGLGFREALVVLVRLCCGSRRPPAQLEEKPRFIRY